MLIPGGVLRVCVPDGPTFWGNYLAIFDAMMSKPRPERDAEPLRAHIAMYFHDIWTRKRPFRSIGYAHKWQYDEVQLVNMFERNGFVEVERRRFHESCIPDVSAVERSDFLIVEGVKP